MNTKEDNQDIAPLVVRLVKAAVRVERLMYGRPVSAEEIRFLVDWSDALVNLAERLKRAD